MKKVLGPALAVPRFTVPNPISVTPKTDSKMANTLFDRIQTHIRATEEKLEPGQELALYYFDRAGHVLRVTDLGYHNPRLMKVWATDLDGLDCAVLVEMASFE